MHWNLVLYHTHHTRASGISEQGRKQKDLQSCGGTPGYMAPDLLSTEKMDVYAFAMVRGFADGDETDNNSFIHMRLRGYVFLVHWS
jgi:hypothetical protein